MPYVHLANGDVETLSDAEWEKAQAESGTPHALRKNGNEHHVIGVYPFEVEHPESEEVKAEREAQHQREVEEFNEWKAGRSE